MGSVPLSDGTTSLFATHREPAWHRLAEPFTRKITDYREMLKEANLLGIKYWFAEAAVVDHPDARFITPTVHVMWTNPLTGRVEVLGTVGERYEIIDLNESFKFLASLGEGKTWETAGVYNEGRTAFASIAYEREIVIDPQGASDKVKLYLLMRTSFDGSTGLSGVRTPVRGVCENTVNVAFGGVDPMFTIRHTLRYAEKMKKVQAELATTDAYFDEVEAEGTVLFQTSATDAQFWGIVENMFPRPEQDKRGSVKKWETKMEKFSQAWKAPQNAPIRGTAWGVFHALTEANQWGRNIQHGRDNGVENFYKAGSGFDGPTNTFRQTALEAARSLVTA